MERTHTDYMRIALDLALRAEGRTRPNPPVGALVVLDDEIVGSGFHPCAGDPHAEIFALNEAAHKTENADLYVTLEPCCTTGRTGPCTEAVVAAGIKRVFVGTLDPNPDVSGKGIKRLKEAGIEVQTGFLDTECRKLIAPFSRHVTTGLPFVVYKAALTLDGFTATRSGDSRWVSCEESRLRVHQMRDRVDAVLVGVGTVILDNPLLTTRLPEGGRSPDRVIVDSSLRVPETAAVLEPVENVQTFIATTSRADTDKIKRLQQKGIQILMLPQDAHGRVDVYTLCSELGKRSYQYILFEGGTQLAGSMWREGLVQRVQWYIAPKIYAGEDGYALLGGEGCEKMSNAFELENATYERCGKDLVVEGDVLNVHRSD